MCSIDRDPCRHDHTTCTVLASLRNTALNLHRLAGPDNIAEACRLTAFSPDRGIQLLTNHQISKSQASESTTPDPCRPIGCRVDTGPS
jgi:hypothetical protein